MKQCTNCGAWAQPNDQFCLQCGTMLRDASASPIARAKKVCGSPLLLISAILFTLYLVINIASVVMSWLNNPIASLMSLNMLLSQLDIPGFSYGDAEFMMILIGLFQVLGLILPTLMACGLWMFYAACKKKPADAPAKTGGLTMLKVGPIMSIIGTIFALILLVILTLIVFIGALDSGESSVLIAAIVMLVLCVVVVLMMIYYFGVLRTLSAVSFAVSQGKRYQKVSMYVIVWNFAILLYNLVSVVLNVVALSFLSAFSLLLYTAAMFLLTISTLMYRSKIEKTLEPAFPKQSQDFPVFQPQQYAPVQQPVYQPQYQAPQQPMNNQYNQQNVYQQYNQQPIYQQPQPSYPVYEEPAQPQYPAYADAAQPEVANEEPIGPENVDA